MPKDKSKETHINVRKTTTFNLKELKELEELEKVVFCDGTEVIKNINLVDALDKIDLPKKIRKPAWVDESDNIVFKDVLSQKGCLNISDHKYLNSNYQQVVNTRFEKVMGTPKWARLPDQPEELDISKMSSQLIKKSTGMEKGKLGYKMLSDLNTSTRCEGHLIKSVKFHPTSTVAMIAGKNGNVTFVQVDGRQNQKLHSIHMDRFPIQKACFINNDEILLSSPKEKFYAKYNLTKNFHSKIVVPEFLNVDNMSKFTASSNANLIAVGGEDGSVYFVCTKSNEYLGTVKLGGSLNALKFNWEGTKLYTHSSEGFVCIWDVKSRTLAHKFYDDGCLSGTAITVSRNEQFLACGSSSGIVNIYDVAAIYQSNPQPLKIIDNLRTPITSLKFNPTSELLVLGSSFANNATKMLHCASMTVFNNFPLNCNTDFKRVQDFDFSPNSGYLGFGTNNSRAHLVRLKYFGNY